MGIPKGYINDPMMNYLLWNEHVTPQEVITQGITTSATNSTVPLRLNWSVYSPTLVQIGNTRMSGIQMLGSTATVDYRWRVPRRVDKNHPIYVRQHWAVDTIGTTLTCTWLVHVATLTSGSTLASSPTQVLNRAHTASSNSSSTVQYALNLTDRGMIAPQGTGPNASQVTADTVEAMHFAIQPGTTTNISLGSVKVYWLGMDIEYTPRLMFGNGSYKEARKLETNLGNQEAGASADY